MGKLSKEEAIKEAREELKKALVEREEANEEYKKLLKRYVWTGPIAPGQRIPSPEAVFDVASIKEVKKVTQRFDDAENRLRKAWSRMVDVYHQH